jgi:molybdopterin/thiamine biosynthesis adenylyltransferase
MRYARQETFLGKDAQKRIENSHVCIVGAGGIGSVASELLARAGIKKMTIIDEDIVEETNLQRQALYTEKDIGRKKLDVLKEKLLDIRSDINIEIKEMRITKETIHEIGMPEIVFDGTDNLCTRFLIDDYCYEKKIPWIFGSGIQDKGYWKLFDYPKEIRFSKIFQNIQLPTGKELGILNTTAHTIASMQVQLLLQFVGKLPYSNKLHHISLNNFTITKINPYLENQD